MGWESAVIEPGEKLCSQNWVCAILQAVILDRKRGLQFSSASYVIAARI
jgi:hypothetical protein